MVHCQGRELYRKWITTGLLDSKLLLDYPTTALLDRKLIIFLMKAQLIIIKLS